VTYLGDQVQIRRESKGVAVVQVEDCPDCREGLGFHLKAVKPAPRKPAEDPYRKTVQRPTEITTRRLGSSGPLPSVPPLTLGPDGIWHRSEPVEAR
jgi:hypothetical protein